MSLNEKKAGSAAVEPLSYNAVVDAVVALQDSGGSLPAGGTTGQVLTKESNADGDADWEDAGGGSQPGVARWLGPFALYGAWWQSIDMTVFPPDAGTFTLTWDGTDSALINWDDDAAAVQAALETIPALTGKVTCSGGPFPGAKVYVRVNHAVVPSELILSNNLLTASGDPVAADPVVSLDFDTSVSNQAAATGPTLAASDMLEDVFVRRREVFPSGHRASIRLDVTGTETWDIPNDGLWKLDDATDNWPNPVSGWDSSDPQYANLASDVEREIWFSDGFYRELPAIFDDERTLFIALQNFSPGNSPQGWAEFYFKVATPSAS